MPSPRVRKSALAFLVAAAVAAFLALGGARAFDLGTVQASLGGLREEADLHPLLFPAAFVATYALATALSFPGATVLTLLAGALFGTAGGTAAVSMASTAGAVGAFLLARHIARDAVRAKLGGRFARLDEGVRREGASFLLFLRLVPLFPFFLVNLGAGLTALRTWTYTWVSWLGMLPGTVVYVNAGTEIARLDAPGDVATPRFLASMAALGLVPLVARLAVGRLRERRALAGHRRPARFDFDMVVIGGGSAGLVSAYVANAAKARVMLVERHEMGGDCLNTGCVPSKAFLKAARVAHQARAAGRYGVRLDTPPRVDFAAVMEHVREAVRKVAPHDSVERFRGLGVDVRRGAARVASPWEVEVDGNKVTTRTVVVASGAAARVPAIAGLGGVPHYTSETFWSLRELPARWLVVGGGPIGCELAQGLARLGARVTLIDARERLLAREEAEVSEFVAGVLSEEGVDIRFSTSLARCEEGAPELPGGRAHRAVVRCDRGEESLEIDAILLAVGRAPRTEGFGLEELGVSKNPDGTLWVDGGMRTSVPTIHACGDVAGPFQLTHAAAHQAWYAAFNALLAPVWSLKVGYETLPRVTFVDPEVARVGISEDEARAAGIGFDVTRYEISELDRAIAEGVDRGFAKFITRKGSGAILGATIVGEHAGELLASVVLAMKSGKGLATIFGATHAYPTFSEANKNAAGLWRQATLPRGGLALLARIHAWRRG